jgi:acetyl-CoA/propionyl-CoA carboxylase biotin carboxyl carrier protein
MELMGSKVAARQTMSAAASRSSPARPSRRERGRRSPARRRDRLADRHQGLGGRGGKGLKVVASADEVERAFEAARREGRRTSPTRPSTSSAISTNPRHVEVQVLADAQGLVIHLGERDCTIQRVTRSSSRRRRPRPSTTSSGPRSAGSPVDAAEPSGTAPQGRSRVLLSSEGEYFFLEMNTRLQVEHTVTELVTGLDLVREQVLIAAGEPLSLSQEDVRLEGMRSSAASTPRIRPQAFLPAPGRITGYREPAGPGVRVDSGVREGSEVVGLYDPLVAKLCVHDVDREHARRRMLRALGEYEIEGITTLVGFHRALLGRACFAAGETCHGVVESPELAEEAEQLSHMTTSVPALSDGRFQGRSVQAEVEGRRFAITLLEPEPPHAELARRRRDRDAQQGHHGAARDAIVTPMQGTVLAVEVAEGDEVEPGQVVCVVEAMKMENEITSPRAGTVSELSVEPGQPVTTGQVICLVTQDEG